ncbi:MAG TPA: hypothetical protein PLS31_05815 [Candidatus Sumerlaeota bacterium]|nr:MAG: hypothetical protein BWY12_01265 [candidate division BRC1 bacterium ADurb.Bin183]HQH11930.1 hypothetical protein [Candidatus Sumerlaeota bacterium]HRR30512.1 hypothetical protein [Candidatus Sumerlaeia bacterium]
MESAHLENNITHKKNAAKNVLDYTWRILLFFLIFIPAVFIQNKQLNIIRKKPRIYRQSLYLPSGKNIRLISIGYDRFMADFIWLRAIQAFGGHWESDRNYQSIYHLFDVITDLDPGFIEAYTFGNLVMGDEGGHQRLGLELINKGIIKNPTNYLLPYWGGYAAFWQMDDPVLAKYYYTRALKARDVPNFVSRILTYMELKSGRYQVAFEKYLRDWLEGIDNQDDIVIGIASERILDVIDEWQRYIITQAAKKYVVETGKNPSDIADLAKAGVIEPYTMIDTQILLAKIRQYSAQPGKMMNHYQEILDACIRENATSLPKHPRGLWYFFNPSLNPENTGYVVDMVRYLESMQNLLSAVRKRIWTFYKEKGRHPYDLSEIYKDSFKIPEPFGGKWIYSPYDGAFYSSVMPAY